MPGVLDALLAKLQDLGDIVLGVNLTIGVHLLSLDGFGRLLGVLRG